VPGWPGPTANDAVGCAVWTAESGLDPVGTAGSHRAYLLVDWPLPWPRDVGEIAELAVLRPALSATGGRLQAMVAPGDTTLRRVILYRRPEGPFVRFERHQLDVDPSDVIDAATALLGGAGAPGVAGAGDQAEAADVLVCTHGRRDRCCGSLGTDLARGLLADPSRLGPGVRVSRTSHTGGHRFAPTAMLFPHGTSWAFADRDLLDTVVHRRGDVAAVLPRYRGCFGIGGPAVQAAERSVLGLTGWSLWDRPRWGEELGDGRVRLHVEDPEGGSTTVWEVIVRPGRKLAAPACGGPADQPVGTAGALVAGPPQRLA
jgi:hypothetical protein